MSRYDHDNYNACDGKRKASATAKTALGLAIGGLSLAALQGGVLNNNGDSCCNTNRGLPSNPLLVVTMDNLVAARPKWKMGNVPLRNYRCSISICSP